MAKVLTVKQPWAKLIATGVKDVENRSWQTHYRGRVLIHASAQPEDSVRAIFTEEMKQALQKRCELVGYLCHDWIDGAIIGSVEIYDVQMFNTSIWAEAGVQNWLLRNAVLFKEPLLNVKGKRGMWEIEDELVKDLK